MKITVASVAFALITIVSLSVAASTENTPDTVDPEADRLALQKYFQSRFPSVPIDEYINGIYALDADSRSQWEEIEEFPPYEFDIEEGEELFNTPFANGKGYGDCFANGGIGIRQNYPLWDDSADRVVTLEKAINECRIANNEEPLPWRKGKLAKISAYMAFTSRDEAFNIKIPNKKAMLAYQDGKKMFFSRQGQLNMSCANCHITGANVRLRAELSSPALGQVTHFPAFRSQWGELGTLHRRYYGCQKMIRSIPFSVQGNELSNLEYYQTYMSNGLAVNGPGARK
jgi:sulfur-oxidizing protein SoxA